jgi:hypothetical protein
MASGMAAMQLRLEMEVGRLAFEGQPCTFVSHRNSAWMCMRALPTRTTAPGATKCLASRCIAWGASSSNKKTFDLHRDFMIQLTSTFARYGQ